MDNEIKVNADRYSIAINELDNIKRISYDNFLWRIENDININSIEKIKDINDKYFKDKKGKEVLTITEKNKYGVFKQIYFFDSEEICKIDYSKTVTLVNYNNCWGKLFDKKIIKDNYVIPYLINNGDLDFEWNIIKTQSWGWEQMNDFNKLVIYSLKDIKLKDSYPLIKEIFDLKDQKSKMIEESKSNIEKLVKRYKYIILDLKDGDSFSDQLESFKMECDKEIDLIGPIVKVIF